MLRWGLQRGWVILPKSSKASRMIENAAVVSPAAFTITAADMEALNSLDEHLVTGWDPITGP